jgi:hypothetical protein
MKLLDRVYRDIIIFEHGLFLHTLNLNLVIIGIFDMFVANWCNLDKILTTVDL